MIQIRDVPADLHSALKARAASEGLTLSGYLKRELARIAEKPTVGEWLERTSQDKPAKPGLDSARLIRQLRDSRRLVGSGVAR